jgi:hypothetical protein
LIILLSITTQFSEINAVTCEGGTILDKSTGQCIPACGSDTKLNFDGTSCIPDSPIVDLGQIEVIAGGIFAGIVATAFGIFWTVYQRGKEKDKEDLELTQNYGEQLSNIMDSERDLKTKLECSLYVEKYLDLLEQLASLYKDGQLREHVADYFENNFCYGLTLKNWYGANIYEDSLQENRWTDLDWWCNGAEKNGKKKRESLSPFNERVLPEIMTKDFRLIPEEDGLSKAELIELIRSYGKDLDGIISKERNLNTQLDCTVYAEQYLDALEQISSLYQRNVIPKRAADYFENRFCYGLTLKKWYGDHVYAKDLQEDRWLEFEKYCKTYIDENGTERSLVPFDERVLPETMTTYFSMLPEEDGLETVELLRLIRDYGKELTHLTDKERSLKTKIDCSVYVEQYLDLLDQIAYLYKQKILSSDVPTYFENNFCYGLTLKKWYDENVFGAQDQENRWSEFEFYCNNAINEDGSFRQLQAFKNGTLPEIMILHYADLDDYPK